MRATTGLLAVTGTIGLVFSLACTGGPTSVEGNRFDEGCPEERCWQPEMEDDNGDSFVWDDPDVGFQGLTFSGLSLYDYGGLQLGPILEGGKFPIDYALTGSSSSVAQFHVEVEGAATLVHEEEGHAVLAGVGTGVVTVRVVDDSGMLVDWTTLRTVELVDIEVVKVGADPQLVAGEEQMVGVRLIAGDADAPLRAFDTEVRIMVDGVNARPDPGNIWDCFLYDVPATATEVEFEVIAGGQSFVRVVPVVQPVD